MAGIAGTLDLEPGLPPAEALVRSMLQALAHRGPGTQTVIADGPVTIGACALPLLDGVAAGTRFGGLDVVVDADLLTPEGSAAPVEQLAAAWATQRAAGLGRLDGGFAAAVWDRRAQTLSLVRDRLGTKPLYVTVAGGRFRFASELRALLVDRAVPRDPDDERILEYLAWGVADHGSGTMLRGIRRTPVATVLEVTPDGRESEHRWHRLAPVRADASVRSLLEAATASRLRTSGPVGVTVSGGLDSATVLALAALHRRATGGDPPVAIVARTLDPALDEWRHARSLVQALDVPVVEVRPDVAGLVDDADAFLLSLDEPCHDASVYGHWRTMRAVRDAGVAVVLEGQFGERFGGVSAWYPQVLFDLLARGLPGVLVAQILHRRRVEGISAVRSLRELAKLAAPRALREVHARPPRWLARDLPFAGPPLLPRRYLDLQLHELEAEDVPLICREVDRDASTFSLVERAPFQDTRIVEHALSLPPETLYRAGWGKAPLREAMRDVLPAAIIDRPTKQGFTVDAAIWLHGPFGELAQRTLGSAAAASRPYWDPAAVGSLVAQARAGCAPTVEVWRAWSVERWLELVVDP